MENKTAVEYVFERIQDLIHESHYQFLADLYESMIELEKQQIINAANIPNWQRWYEDKYNSCGEQYYFETYKKTEPDDKTMLRFI